MLIRLRLTLRAAFGRLSPCGRLNDVEGAKDRTSPGKMLRRPGVVGRTHVHDDLGGLLGLSAVFGHGRGKLAQGLRTPILGHHQQIGTLGIDHVGHVTPATTRTGLPRYARPSGCLRQATSASRRFIHQDAPHLAPVFDPVGGRHVVIAHPPQPIVHSLQQTRRGRHAHLLGQQKGHHFHHQRKPAGPPRPRHLHWQNPVFGTSHPWYPRLPIGAEVQGSPLFVDRVVHRTELPTSWTGKLRARRKIQLQAQLPLRQSVSLLTTLH